MPASYQLIGCDPYRPCRYGRRAPRLWKRDNSCRQLFLYHPEHRTKRASSGEPVGTLLNPPTHNVARKISICAHCPSIIFPWEPRHESDRDTSILSRSKNLPSPRIIRVSWSGSMLRIDTYIPEPVFKTSLKARLASIYNSKNSWSISQ